MAKKKKLDLKGFLKDTKGGGDKPDKLNLKKEGKAIVFLHPDSGIYKRNVYWFPVYAEVIENNEKVMSVYQSQIIVDDLKTNPIAIFRKALKDDDEFDMDDIILSVGKGKSKQEFSKGDILGEQGYDWKKGISYRTEYLFGIVDKDNANQVQVLEAPKSLGKKITKVIEDQIEEEGDEDGNPFINPYAFKLTYDEDALPQDKYNAVWNKAEPTKEIQALLDGEGVDLEEMVEPTDMARVCYILREALVPDENEFGLDLSAADDFDPKELNLTNRDGDKEEDSDTEDEKPAKKGKSGKKDKAGKKDKKPSKKDPEPEEEEEEEEEEVEEKPAKKKGGKKAGKTDKKPAKKKPEPEPEEEEEEEDDTEEEVIECPDCGEEIPADSETCPECGEDIDPF